MRTTVTLDPDVADLVQRDMRERGVNFKEAVNTALRSALRPVASNDSLATPTFRLGIPRVDMVHATRLVGELEDDEMVRKLDVGK